MTGFARQDGAFGETSWAWEFRAVNGKGLDVRLRLPPGFERLEVPVRKACTSALSRGNVQANLTITASTNLSMPAINPTALESVLSAIKDIDEKAHTSHSTAAQILALRGVLEMSEPESTEESNEALDAALLASLEEALKALSAHRAAEGAVLGVVLLAHVDEIERLSGKAEADSSRTPEIITARLEEQVSKLVDASATLDRDRLHQEAIMLATKADIREELDRLTAHVASARELLSDAGPIGRKLEFLAQEFNREANTLCSKSNAVSVTEIGLAMKVVIDQFREQVLNIE